MNRNLYGIFMKYPELGRVKTRLAKDIGHKKAAEIYRQLAGQTIKNTFPVDQKYRRIVFFDPPDRMKDFQAWLEGEEFIPQQGNDIGERMDRAIRELLGLGAEKVVLTGADIPALNSAIIAKAFATLDHADIVIGPAADGGYYLIGMKEPHGEIFYGIPWSSGEVLKQTVRVIEDQKLQYQSLITLSDLDTASDYQRFLTQEPPLIPGRSS